MLQQIMENYVCSYIVIATGSIAIAIRILLGFRFWQLFKKSKEIGMKKHEFNESVKKIFKVSYDLEMNVNNVDKFVDKYVYKQKLMGIFLHTWEKICGQTTALCMACTVISVLLAVLNQSGQDRILQETVLGIFMWTMLITVYALSTVSKKKEDIRFYLAEYLENVYAPRLKKEKEDPQFFQQYRKEMEAAVQSAKTKKAGKKISKKNAHRAELERMKQELVEELKQERLANEKKRLLEKQQEMEQEAIEEKISEAVKQMELATGAEAEETITNEPEVAKESFLKKEAGKKNNGKSLQLREESQMKTEAEEESQILQAILREYLGEI